MVSGSWVTGAYSASSTQSSNSAALQAGTTETDNYTQVDSTSGSGPWSLSGNEFTGDYVQAVTQANFDSTTRSDVNQTLSDQSGTADRPNTTGGSWAGSGRESLSGNSNLHPDPAQDPPRELSPFSTGIALELDHGVTPDQLRPNGLLAARTRIGCFCDTPVLDFTSRW
ncbi:MAG TPA: hypothetical protein VKA46_38325 [Gemmataceae bacterium]|nr:hypothetical protein [Gemmataceae bacterium]